MDFVIRLSCWQRILNLSWSVKQCEKENFVEHCSNLWLLLKLSIFKFIPTEIGCFYDAFEKWLWEVVNYLYLCQSLVECFFLHVLCTFTVSWYIMYLMHKLQNMWPAPTNQGTSRKVQVSHFTCTVAGINMTNEMIRYFINLISWFSMAINCGAIKQNESELEHIIFLVFYLVLFSIQRATFCRKPH